MGLLRKSEHCVKVLIAEEKPKTFCAASLELRDGFFKQLNVLRQCLHHDKPMRKENGFSQTDEAKQKETVEEDEDEEDGEEADDKAFIIRMESGNEVEKIM
eukprot:Selendium_serpulae@DN8515_c0_g1_i1.p2